MLSKSEIIRYNKQLLLPEIGKSGQEKIKNASVLIVGAGGLGCPVLQYLAAAGVGTIGILDYDVVELSNLQRQILYATHDIGKPKVDVASIIISGLNPYVNVHAINKKLETHNALDLISRYDIVVDCSDNFETRYIINDACVLLSKSFVYGGIHKFEGQLSVFNLQLPSGNFGPTYRCAFPEIAAEEAVLNCSMTGVIGTLPGMIGTLQANEVIKMIAGIGNICSGQILLFNALTLAFSEIKISRDETLWNGIPKSKEEFINRNYFCLNERLV